MHSQYCNTVFAAIHQNNLSKTDLQIVCLLPGSVFFVVGLLMKYFTPKYPNMSFGYRTPFSEKNEQTWNEANSYSANLVIAIGIINGIVWGYLGYEFRNDPNNDLIVAIGTPTLIGSAIALLILTELHLRKIFDKDGNRRKSNDSI